MLELVLVSLVKIVQVTFGIVATLLMISLIGLWLQHNRRLIKKINCKAVLMTLAIYVMLVLIIGLV